MYSKAYYKALRDGEARNTRIPIIIVGSDRVGKSSLRKHLPGLPFHIEEPSTNGIEVDVVELTAENAKDPWRTIGGRFFTTAEEAEEEAFKNTAELLSDAKQEIDVKIDINYLHFQSKKIERIKTTLKSKKALKSNDSSGEQSALIKVFVHDFAGQSIFYDTHFCFLKMLCPYVLVVDASVDLDVLQDEIFLIDNKSVERNGSEIRKLRELLYELCTSILKKQPPMPVRWLKFEGVLNNMMLTEGKMHISIEDARAAAKSCEIRDPDAALKFLHHQDVIVHHSESPVVVLDPPWLMNLFTEIITVPPKKIPKDAPLYGLLMSKGILMQDKIRSLLKDLMKQFSLIICPWEYEGKCAYVVPSVAPLMDEGEDIQERLSTKRIIPVFIHFNWSYVPLGYYTRFQIQMINLCREDLLRIPEIYCNYTLLSFRRPEGEFDVYLIKIPGKIKIGIVGR